jgi:predicted RecA/RadA family phage recombinase
MPPMPPMPMRLYAAVFWLTDEDSEEGRSGTGGAVLVDADVVDDDNDGAAEAVGGIAAVEGAAARMRFGQHVKTTLSR